MGDPMDSASPQGMKDTANTLRKGKVGAGMKEAKILVVDDELNMRLVLKAMLKKEGYQVVTAADGHEALEILRKEKIAVVATDLKMPRLDGMGLLDRIMKDDPALPVIILTAYGTVANAVDALKKGAFDYLTKPFEQDELKTVILKAVIDAFQEKHADDIFLELRSIHVAAKILACFLKKIFKPG